MMSPVPLSAILDYAMTQQASDAAGAARDAADEFLRSSSVFRPGAERELFDARMAAARVHADAHLYAVDVPVPALVDEMRRESVLGERLRAVAALHARIGDDATALLKSPPQVLAAWHIRATAGMGLPDEHRGRPRAAGDECADPLNASLPAADPAAAIAVAIRLLSANPRGVPPIAHAALAHVALAAGQPFAAANAILGRAAAHAVLVARGTDPAGRIAVVCALSEMGRPAYVRALRSASAMTEEAIDGWVRWWCEVVASGARYSADVMGEALRDIDAHQAAAQQTDAHQAAALPPTT